MEFWIIMIAFIAMGGTCSLAGTWWDRKNRNNKEIHLCKEQKMFNSFYKTVVVECSSGVENMAKEIEKTAEEDRKSVV